VPLSFYLVVWDSFLFKILRTTVVAIEGVSIPIKAIEKQVIVVDIQSKCIARQRPAYSITQD